MSKISTSNSGRPAPKWFRKFRKIFTHTENFAMGVLLTLGYGDQSVVMLLVKLSTSFILDVFDTLLGNGEQYASDKIFSNSSVDK